MTEPQPSERHRSPSLKIVKSKVGSNIYLSKTPLPQKISAIRDMVSIIEDITSTSEMIENPETDSIIMSESGLSKTGETPIISRFSTPTSSTIEDSEDISTDSESEITDSENTKSYERITFTQLLEKISGQITSESENELVVDYLIEETRHNVIKAFPLGIKVDIIEALCNRLGNERILEPYTPYSLKQETHFGLQSLPLLLQNCIDGEDINSFDWILCRNALLLLLKYLPPLLNLEFILTELVDNPQTSVENLNPQGVYLRIWNSLCNFTRTVSKNRTEDRYELTTLLGRIINNNSIRSLDSFQEISFDKEKWDVKITTELLRRIKTREYTEDPSCFKSGTLNFISDNIIIYYKDSQCIIPFSTSSLFIGRKNDLLLSSDIFGGLLIRSDDSLKILDSFLIRKRFIQNDLINLNVLGNSLTDLHVLLTNPKMSLLHAVVENFETRMKRFDKNIAKSLLYLFHAKGLSMRLIRYMIWRETTNGKNNSVTLFRSSSVSSKCIALYGHLIGREFLIKTLSPPIDMVSKVKRHLEMNDQLVGEEMAEKNKEALRILANEFIGKVILGLRDLPLQIRLMCRSMRMAAKRVFPQGTNQSLNNFLFLRFIVPVIATPETFGVIEDPNEIGITFRRNLVQISKIVQNVGNQSLTMMGQFSKLNEFIRKSSVRIFKFYENVTNLTEPIPEPIKIELSEYKVEKAMKLIHKHVEENWEDIRDILDYEDCRGVFDSFTADFIENSTEPPKEEFLI